MFGYIGLGIWAVLAIINTIMVSNAETIKAIKESNKPAEPKQSSQYKVSLMDDLFGSGLKKENMKAPKQ